MTVYPIFLNDLHRRRCVVIGGNHEAVGKIEGLLKCRANVTVFAADVEHAIIKWSDAGVITWHPRDYRAGDLKGAFLVIAVRSDAETNRRIYEEAEAERALVNVMDDVPNCSFVAGSVVRSGPLTVSVSTSGVAPALAVRIRERLEAEFGPEYAAFLETLAAIRDDITRSIPDFEARRELWYRIIDSDVLDHFRRDDAEGARSRLEEISGLSLTDSVA